MKMKKPQVGTIKCKNERSMEKEEEELQTLISFLPLKNILLTKI